MKGQVCANVRTQQRQIPRVSPMGQQLFFCRRKVLEHAKPLLGAEMAVGEGLAMLIAAATMTAQVEGEAQVTFETRAFCKGRPVVVIAAGAVDQNQARGMRGQGEVKRALDVDSVARRKGQILLDGALAVSGTT